MGNLTVETLRTISTNRIWSENNHVSMSNWTRFKSLGAAVPYSMNHTEPLTDIIGLCNVQCAMCNPIFVFYSLLWLDNHLLWSLIVNRRQIMMVTIFYSVCLSFGKYSANFLRFYCLRMVSTQFFSVNIFGWAAHK